MALSRIAEIRIHLSNTVLVATRLPAPLERQSMKKQAAGIGNTALSNSQ